MNQPQTSAAGRRRPAGRRRYPAGGQQSPASPAHAGRPGTDRRAGGRDGNGNCCLLTEEELAILRLTADGLPLGSVARRVGMSSRTVRRRLRCLCDRLGVTHPIQAVVWAAQRGLI